MDGAEPGVVLRTGANGYLVKRAAASRIPARWAEPVDSTVAMYVERLGARLHSVYVRGSVSLGQPRDFFSDLDTFAIVTGPERRSDTSWALEHSLAVRRRWPFVAGVEVSVYPLSAATRSRRVAAMINLLGACVHGPDLGPGLAAFRPDAELIFHSWDLPRDLAVAKRILATADDPALVGETCVWIAKRMVRSGFELVMSRMGCYTRDLVTCYELFARHYPDRAADMEDVLSLALSETADRERCIRAIEQVGDWLYGEVCAEYGAARIEQLMSGNQA